MGKSRKGNDFQREYISQSHKDNHFFRVYSSLLDSQPFNDLTPAAQMLYIRMGIHSNGKTEFQYPKSEYMKYLSIGGFMKAKKQLLDHGFITETKYRTAPAIYRLHYGWKSTENILTVHKTEQHCSTKQNS